jgi:hypothetical protein
MLPVMSGAENVYLRHTDGRLRLHQRYLGAENFDVVYKPVRVTKGLRLRRDIAVTARIRLCARGRAPDRTSPGPTESDVENLVHVSKSLDIVLWYSQFACS